MCELRNPAHTPFGAIFQTEVLLNSKRAAPFVMLALFGFNAWLWTVKGPAMHNGWAMNSDHFIIRNFMGFSFLTLPLFTALIMGDPVGRDFRTGMAPLIFSKPVSRATYLLGKFSGNFFVLVCCQSAFALMMLLLQAFPSAEMMVQPVRVFPYFKHFFFFVVVSQLALAAIHFTVGTLTRNPKIVYGLAVFFYPLLAAYQILFLKTLPPRWRGALDPLLMNWAGDRTRLPGGGYIKAELINQLAYSYDADAMANRALMALIAAACLTILYVRFSMVERAGQYEENKHLVLSFAG